MYQAHAFRAGRCVITAVMLALPLFAVCLTPVNAQEAGGKSGDKGKDSPDGTAGKSDAGNVAADYEAVKLRDLLSTDFMLAHPDDRKPSGLTPEEAAQVRETLAGGVRVLLAMQDPSGVIDTRNRPDAEGNARPYAERSYVTGAHALAVWTLVASGAEPSTRAVKEAVKAMVGLAMSGGATAEDAVRVKFASRLLCYELSLVLMAFHALAVEREAEQQAKDAAKESKGKKEDDARGRGERSTRDKVDSASEGRKHAALLYKQLSLSEQACLRAVYEALLERQAGDGAWSYRSSDSSSGDGSNAHFAMLGILSAYRTGLEAPKREILEKAATWWMAAQQKDGPTVEVTFREPEEQEGEKKERKSSATRRPKSVSTKARGFGYSVGSPRIGEVRDSTRLSMSAAGVICLGIVRHLMLGGAREGKGVDAVAKIDIALKDGLAYLAHVLPSTDPVEKDEEETGPDDADGGESKTSRGHPFGMHGHAAYTTLAIERAGILNGCDTFGRCEWYPLGVRTLLPLLKSVREFKPAKDKDKDDEKREGRKQKDGKPGEGRLPIKEGIVPYSRTDTCMELLFLKGYLDKTPTAPKGPVITGGGKPVKPAEEPKPDDPPKPAPVEEPKPEPKPEPEAPEKPAEEPKRPEDPLPPIDLPLD